MVVKTEIPEDSILKQHGNSYDFVDSYESCFVDKEQTIDATKVGKMFFMRGPKWIDHLFAVRNKVVALFGLKTSGTITDRQQQLDNFKCECGEQLGLFRVFDKTKNEVILGEDDKHLNFRVSLFVEPLTVGSEMKKLTITTAVKFNNAFGRLYFLPVWPLHKLIVPAMLKGIIGQIKIEKQNLAKTL